MAINYHLYMVQLWQEPIKFDGPPAVVTFSGIFVNVDVVMVVNAQSREVKKRYSSRATLRVSCKRFKVTKIWCCHSTLN